MVELNDPEFNNDDNLYMTLKMFLMEVDNDE